MHHRLASTPSILITKVQAGKSGPPAGSIWLTILALLWLAAIAACQPTSAAEEVSTPTAAPPTIHSTSQPATPVSATATAVAIANVAPPTPTAVHTVTPSPTATATNTPTPTATPTPIGPCAQRRPTDDLLTLVTRQYGLSRDYEPADLAALSDYLPVGVTLGYPTLIREVIALPLQAMIQDMQAAGLQPFIISGYRSYASQAIAWNKWLEREGDRGAIVSAPPGHSEHQLGTTVDFGSPELEEIVGEEIEFHTYFYRTREGFWLAENAHKYGFTLSYPRQAFDLTGFYYEPWHYRYVGVELATHLRQTGSFLTEYQLLTQEPPCIP
jgi:zinc D-Ala-D-Ala carboxypeptidase